MTTIDIIFQAVMYLAAAASTAKILFDLFQHLKEKHYENTRGN